MNKEAVDVAAFVEVVVEDVAVSTIHSIKDHLPKSLLWVPFKVPVRAKWSAN